MLAHAACLEEFGAKRCGTPGCSADFAPLRKLRARVEVVVGTRMPEPMTPRTKVKLASLAFVLSGVAFLFAILGLLAAFDQVHGFHLSRTLVKPLAIVSGGLLLTSPSTGLISGIMLMDHFAQPAQRRQVPTVD